MMQKEQVIQSLREQGYRITKQRRILLDIILEEPCTCCKEIYYKAVKQDSSIGMATVYRMINTLEEIGALSRNTMFELQCGEECICNNACRLEFADGTSLELSAANWNEVVRAGLRQCGYGEGKQLTGIAAKLDEKDSQ